MNSLLISAMVKFQVAAYEYWGELDNKLSGVGDASNEFVTLCQNYWFIPLIFTVVIVAGLIIGGGKSGRIQAKSILFWALLSVAVIMSVPSIVALITGFFAPDTANLG